MSGIAQALDQVPAPAEPLRVGSVPGCEPSLRLHVSANASLRYLNCPRCRLSIALRPHRASIRHCPRCVARDSRLVEMFISTLAADALYAKSSLSQAEAELPPGDIVAVKAPFPKETP
jgi:hypothetical protein